MTSRLLIAIRFPLGAMNNFHFLTLVKRQKEPIQGFASQYAMSRKLGDAWEKEFSLGAIYELKGAYNNNKIVKKNCFYFGKSGSKSDNPSLYLHLHFTQLPAILENSTPRFIKIGKLFSPRTSIPGNMRSSHLQIDIHRIYRI